MRGSLQATKKFAQHQNVGANFFSDLCWSDLECFHHCKKYLFANLLAPPLHQQTHKAEKVHTSKSREISGGGKVEGCGDDDICHNVCNNG